MRYVRKNVTIIMRRASSRLLLWVLMAFLVFFTLIGSIGAQETRRGVGATLAPRHESGVCIYLATEYPDTIKVGNGLVVNSWGYVLTTKHLLHGTTGILTVKFCCGETVCEDYDAEFVDSSYTSDLALLRVINFPFWDKTCPPRSLADDNTLFSEGTDVDLNPYRCTGYKVRPYSPKGTILSLSEDAMRIDSDLAVQQGASGSPVKMRGSDIVIGMVSASESVMEAEVITRDKSRWVIFVPPLRIRVDMVAQVVPLGQIKKFLKEQGVEYYEDHWKPLGPAPYGGNPHLKKDYTEEHLGMLNLIQYYIEDIVNKGDQFQDRVDPDVLLETYFEIRSFLNKLQMQPSQERTEARQNAENFYIRGLIMKATSKEGIRSGMKYFSRAVLEDPTFAEPRYQIATYHMRCTGDTAKIKEQIEKGRESDALNGELLRAYAMFHLYSNNCDLARFWLDEAEKHLPALDDDPRIPFCRGLSFDPYWRTIDSFQTWSEDFQKTRKRNPAFPEIQIQKDSLLFADPQWNDNILRALEFFDCSRQRAPTYVRPLNSAAWIKTNEVLRGDSTHQSRLRELLREMETFVEYGLTDPRVFNTLALGYAALRDCETARHYLDISKSTTESILIAPRYKRDLILENQRVERICELLTTEPPHDVSMKNPDFPK